jgi:acyl carrier protein
MASEKIEQKFFSVLSSMLKVSREALSRESERESVEEWDSLKHMHLMLALEEEFEIEFSDDELANLRSAGALLDSIEAKLGA